MPVEELAQKLISWIRDVVLVAEGKGVIVGMSGGLDSSVTAVLCRNAFSDTTLGIVMPCYSDNVDKMHAQLVSARFNIPIKIVMLDEVFDSMSKMLSDESCDEVTRRLAKANIKARLRMVTLYYYANCLNYLVAGSGNKSELSIGYFTKYGDSGVDLLPLGALVKRRVRELATYLDIPEDIINKPPSAGLWAGQSDEEELGLTYNELDQYLTAGTTEKDVKERIDFMIFRSKHKCSLPPIPPL